MSIQYWAPEGACMVATMRLADEELQEKSLSYLGGELPPGFEGVDQPIAVFAPYLARGSEVEINFLERAKRAGFSTLVATYEDTAYVTANSDVVDCYRPPIKLPKGQQTRQWVVPEGQRGGKLGDAETIYDGLNIVNYWANIRQASLCDRGLPTDDTVVDFSEWYAFQAERFGWKPSMPNKAPFYYMASMALYASGRAVLFDVPEYWFDKLIIVPAIEKVESILKETSLIVNVLAAPKRDWTDLSFLSAEQVQDFQETGRIAVKND